MERKTLKTIAFIKISVYADIKIYFVMEEFMEKEMYKNIMGFDIFFKYFHDKPWHFFHDVLEFRWYREFDYEEWHDKTYLDLKMASQDNQNVVIFKLTDVSVEGPCYFNGWISGLDIINMHKKGTWLEHQYELIDFEDSSIHLYCNEVEIQVITVNGKNI